MKVVCEKIFSTRNLSHQEWKANSDEMDEETKLVSSEVANFIHESNVYKSIQRMKQQNKDVNEPISHYLEP